MKKLTLMLLVLLMLVSGIFGVKEKSGISFFSPKSFYLYLEAGTLNICPYEPYDYWDRERSFVMVYGAGYSLLNLDDTFKLNFEFEFIKPKYEIYYDGIWDNQKINFFNYKLNIEYLIGKGRYSFFAGIGLSSIKYLENDIIYDYSVTGIMVVDIGFKVRISKNAYFRAEYKYFVDPAEGIYDSYYDDYYYEDDPEAIANTLALGIEIKF